MDDKTSSYSFDGFDQQVAKLGTATELWLAAAKDRMKAFREDGNDSMNFLQAAKKERRLRADMEKASAELDEFLDSGATRYVHTGLPGYMRASLHTASSGGENSYESAGYTLGRHLETEMPMSAEAEQWDDALRVVDAFMDDDAKLTAWLAATYPRIWEQVPPRRRTQFVAGVRRGRIEDSQA